MVGISDLCWGIIIFYSSVESDMMDSEVYRADIQQLISESHPWSKLSGHKVLVTGSTGMIGSMLVDVLASKMSEFGFELIAMSRNGSEMERLFSEYRDIDEFRMIAHDVNDPIPVDCDTVFHCASNTHPKQYSEDPIGTISTNIIGLNNLLEMASRVGGGRFVFMSSVEIYGQNRGDVDYFDESYCGYIDCNTIRAGYNEGKRAGEALCQAYGSQRGLDFVIPRLCRLYGPSLRDGDTKAISQFIRNAVRGEDIVLKSKGDQLFSYCYSADAVSAILHIFFNGECGMAYNVAGLDSDVTLAQVAQNLADLSGTKVIFDLPGDIERRGYSIATKAVLDISRLRATGWAPSVSLRDGLQRTVSSLASRI